MDTRVRFARPTLTGPVPPQQHTPVQAPPVSWRDAVPVLSGECCLLRELRCDDARQLLPILTVPEVARFMSPPPTTVERFTWFIEWSQRQREAGRYIGFAIVPRGHSWPVGLVQLREREDGFRTAEWGIALAPEYWGAGLFVDAARLLFDFAFDDVGVHRLEARAALANARSQAAMQKLGAVQEGVLRESLITADGRRHDQVLWSVIDAEWRQLTAPPELQQVH